MYGSIPEVLWPLLTSWHIENESIPGPPQVRASSFPRCLPDLLIKRSPNGVWTLAWCGTSSDFISLLSGFCASVPGFAVSLPSVPTLRLITLRLANDYSPACIIFKCVRECFAFRDTTPAHKGLAPFRLITYLSINEKMPMLGTHKRYMRYGGLCA